MAATSVAKKDAADLAVYDYGAEAGQGFENQTQSDYSIPFIGVLQAISPQTKDPSEGGIEGARAGMLFNTVTEEMIPGKDGVEFVAAHTEHVFVEWVPREKGGGFVAVHQLDSEVVKKAKAAAKTFGKYQTVAGNDLVETYYIYGVICDGDEPGEMAVIAFTSTKIKVYKRFNTKVGMFQIRLPDGRKIKPPLFAHLIRLTTVSQKNNKGSFYNFDLSPAKGDLTSSLIKPNDPRMEAAKNCRDMILEGAARASYETQDATGGERAEGGAEEAPF